MGWLGRRAISDEHHHRIEECHGCLRHRRLALLLIKSSLLACGAVIIMQICDDDVRARLSSTTGCFDRCVRLSWLAMMRMTSEYNRRDGSSVTAKRMIIIFPVCENVVHSRSCTLFARGFGHGGTKCEDAFVYGADIELLRRNSVS